MSTLNDLKFSVLYQQGFRGSLNDMLASFYKERGAVTEYSWLSSLLNKGGSLNDLRYEYLISQGFTGSHNDMLLSSLLDNKYFNSFSPTSLFAGGEQGAWYDPSDFSTMFQDAAGTTPVTAVEQPVGLILDKSKGLVLGPELVTNGDFSDGATGWTANVTNSTISVSAGALTLTRTSTGVATAYTAINTVVGKPYKVDGLVTGTTGSIGLLYFSASASSSNPFNLFTYSAVSVAPGSKSFVFIAKATTTFIHLVIDNNGPGGTATIDNISVRELPGNHATQTTSTSRPVLQQDGNGKYYIRLDGVDDWLITPTITPGTDKAQVFAGVRKLSDAAAGLVAELSANINSNNGAVYLAAPANASPSGDYAGASRGSVFSGSNTARYAVNAPDTSIVTLTADIAGDLVALRTNGVSRSSGTGDQGTGNYLAYPLYIGRRGGTALPFNGYLYGLIVRFGANLPTDTIASTETWLNGKTGAY